MARDSSIDLWAYYGFGVVLNDAQLEHLTAVLTLPPGTIHVWRWANRTGKGQPLDEPVLTPQGWRPIGELRVGDPIMAGDGSATIVTGVYPQGPKAVFRLTFDDGAWTRCDESHLWTVLDPSARFKRPGEVRRKGAWTGGRLAARFRQWDTLSLAEIRRRWGDRPPPSQRCAIPTAPTAQLTARPVPVEPYLLGLLLGDGGVSGDSVRFTTADPELAAAVGGQPIGRTAQYSVRAATGARSLGLMGKHSYDKSVPREYLDNAPDIRLAVLQGLMDTDGSVQTNGHVEFSSTSQRLAADVVELVRSLGGRAKAVERQTYYRYGGQRRAGRRSWRVHVRAGTVPLFRLPRKAERLAAWRQRWAGDRLLYSIEAIGEAETVCIRVADPSETYITRDYIVTHNTTGLDLLYGWAAWYKWRYIAPEFDDWFAYRYKILHSAPLGELAGKAYELWEELLSGAAMQQRDPINQRQRPALLAPFFAATKIVDATGVDRPTIHCANGAQIDFRSTQAAARLESDSWWLIG